MLMPIMYANIQSLLWYELTISKGRFYRTLHLSFLMTMDFKHFVTVLGGNGIYFSMQGGSTKKRENSTFSTRMTTSSPQPAMPPRSHSVRHQPYPQSRPSTSQGFAGRVMMPPITLRRPGSGLSFRSTGFPSHFGIAVSPSPPLPMIREVEEYAHYPQFGVGYNTSHSFTSQSSISQPSSSLSPTFSDAFRIPNTSESALSEDSFGSPSQAYPSFTTPDISARSSPSLPDGPPPRRTLPFKTTVQSFTTTLENTPSNDTGCDPDEIPSPKRGGTRVRPKPSNRGVRVRSRDIDPQLLPNHTVAENEPKMFLTAHASTQATLETAEVGLQVTEDGLGMSQTAPILIDHATQTEETRRRDAMDHLGVAAADLLARISDMWNHSVNESVGAAEETGCASREEGLRIALHGGLRLAEDMSTEFEEYVRRA